METKKPIMNVKEVAKYLDVSTATIYRYIRKHKIPAFRVGKMWRFRKEKISNWMENQENAQ
jgi:excisionase family DNA binding protein